MTSSSGEAIGLKDEISALKRERVVQAAFELFYERGYDNTTLDAVAERLGVTKPFIYAHFGSKGDLLAEACSRGVLASVAALDAAIASPGSIRDKLARLGRDFVTVVLDHRTNIAILSREEKNLSPDDAKRIGAMRRGFDDKLVKLLEAGIAKGEFNVPDARVASLAISGMVSWTYAWYRPGGRFTADEIADQMSQMILGMVGAART